MDNKIFMMQPLKLIILLLFIFLLAGTWNYWQGLIFFAYILILTAILLVLFKNKLDLGKERLHPGKGMKKWDKVIAIFGIILFSLVMVISVLDSGRFGWTNTLTAYSLLAKILTNHTYILSYIIMTFGNTFLIWAMYSNKWFSSVARIQKDRKQKVCSSGPYKIVRHPGYLGGIFMLISLPLALGSVYGLIPSLFMVILVIIRTALEDKMLQKQLPGYKKYAKSTKYKLFPGLW